MSGAQWSQVAERGSLLGLRFVVGCYRLFGRPLSVVLLDAIVVYYYFRAGSARAASRAYLRRLARWPEGAAALGRPPDRRATFRHLRTFALSILDRLALWFGESDALAFEVEGIERFHELLREGRGAILVGAHLGSFDALRALADRDARVVNVLMFTNNAPRINAIFRELSPDAQLRVIPAGKDTFDTVLRIRDCIARGEIVALLGDRVEPGLAGRTLEVPFLGDDVELPQTPYLMAGLLHCPLFFMVALRAGPGRYRVFAEVLAERVDLRDDREKRIRELAQAYVARLERHCLAAPYQWFNFYDYWREGP